MTSVQAFCTACGSPVERQDARCIVCGCFTEPLPAEAEDREEILQCTGCGAAMAYSAEARAPRCAFCRSVLELHSITNAENAEAFVPFRVDEASARATLLASRLRPPAELQELRPVWWVGWLVDVEVLVSWSAECGGGRRMAPRTGQHRMEITGQVVPGSLGIAAPLCLQLVRALDVAAARPQPEGPRDAVIERFLRGQQFAAQYIRRAINNYVRAHVPALVGLERGQLQATTTLVTRMRTKRLAFPAWIATYRKEDIEGRMIVHGQDLRCVLGEPPRMRTRSIVLAVLAALILIVGLVVLDKIN